MRVQALFDWLVDGAPGAGRPEGVVARMGTMLLESGVRVARIAAFVRTLHPQVMGRSFVWRRGAAEVAVTEAPYALLQSDVYARSPVGRVFATGVELRRRLDGRDPVDYQEMVGFAAEGLTDYLVLPLTFTDGQVHAITFSTDAPGGFDGEELEALRTITRPLSRIAEIMALRRTATNLLSAYVGRGAGERILRGQVRLGDTERIRCAIWFSDLRGFTSLSGRSEPLDLIAVLNQVFDCQVPAVEQHGGEVLKFMGDGMLAIFPIGIDRPETPIGPVCASAVQAAHDAFAALGLLNEARAGRGLSPLSFGVSLHLGEVAYGNIGGAGRLDFTCIGPAVNLAARIEGLTARLSKRLLLTAEFAAAVPLPTRALGTFELKGIERSCTVYELAG